VLSFKETRQKRYEDLREDSLRNGGDFDNFRRWPYTCLKGRILAELASLLVYVLQFTSVKANHITFFYAFSGIVGALCLGSNNTELILFGVSIFFFKNLPDWVDGFIARLKNQTSQEGKILDPWGALVNSHAFIIGFGLYAFNSSNQILNLYILILIIFLRAIDLRNYMFIQFMNAIINDDLALNGKKKYTTIKSNGVAITSKMISRHSKNKGYLAILSKLIFSFLDDRSRSVDFVCLIIVLELFLNQISLSPYVMLGYLLKYLFIFFGGIYIVYLKKTPSKLYKSLIDSEDNV
tara:strand:+ start:9375 stop:10256 length:882 start_codon:yes stop_codon:yes gene_type:complete